jgi:hypothetical protein
MFALYFFSEEYDSDIVIQPGTYTIDDTQDYMTVLAGAGVVNNSIYPSFYGYLSEDGKGIVTPLYFLVGGTVEVENRDGKLYVEVNAVNSYNVPIHIVFDGTKQTTAVENITTEKGVTKRIENGQLLINRNGNTYNVLGASVK